MKRFALRIGDIEVRKTLSSDNYDYEVVKWSPNKLYGCEDEYKEVSPLGEITYKKYGVTYSESCFKHPEVCYVVSFITWNSGEPCWEVREVGIRPFELKDEDFKNWCKIMRMIWNILPIPNDEEDTCVD